MEDQIQLRGSLRIAVNRINGESEYREVNNLVVQAGRSAVLHQIRRTPASYFYFTYIAIGTDGTAPAASDSNIPSYLFNATTTMTYSTNTITQNPPKLNLVCQWAASNCPNSNFNPVTVREAVLVIRTDNSFGFQIFARATYGAITLQTSDALNATWTISG